MHGTVCFQVDQGGDVAVFIEGCLIEGCGQHIAFHGEGAFPCCGCNLGQGNRLNSGDLHRQSGLFVAVPVSIDLGIHAVKSISAVQGDHIAAVKGQGVIQGQGIGGCICHTIHIGTGLCLDGIDGLKHFRDRNVIDPLDAGAGDDVMELVLQDDLVQIVPVLVHRLAGQDVKQLQIVHGDFRIPVVLLHLVHLGQGTTVQLQVQLAVVNRQLILALLHLLHEVADGGRLDHRHTVQALGTLQEFQHTVGGTAAAVTVAVGSQTHIAGALVHQLLGHGGQEVHIGNEVGPVQVGQHFAAVQAPPDEGVGRELVQVAPVHLGGVEILDTAALHDLRNSSAVAEGIGKPEGIGLVIQVLHGIALAVHKLTDHGFGACDVAVAFHPDTAVGLIAALSDALLDSLEDVGVILPHPVQVQDGGLNEGILGVQVHQGQGLGIGTGALADGLLHGPQPGGIHVGMTHHEYTAPGSIAGALFQSRSQDLGNLGSAGAEFLHGSGAGILDQVRERGHQVLVGLHGHEILTGEPCQLQHGGGVEAEVPEHLVQNRNADTFVLVDVILFHHTVPVIEFIRLGTGAVVTGIAFQSNVDGGARYRIGLQEHGAVVAAQKVILGVDDAHRHLVLEAQHFRSMDIGNHTQLLARQGLRNGEVGAQPQVAVLPAPLGADSHFLHFLRLGRLAQMLHGLHAQNLVRHSHSLENVFGIEFQDAFDFRLGSLDISFVCHNISPFHYIPGFMVLSYHMVRIIAITAIRM